jgi:cytochrome c-type biogenesis protein CcmH
MARVLFLLLLLLPLPSGAVEPDEILDDPALEARARELSKEIRCVICQNESIDSSNAGIARDLRILVRDRLTAGDSDREVKDFLVARYGDYVLLKPPVKPETWALWFGPAIILLIGGLATAVFLMRRPRQPAAGTPSLSEAEQARLETLLKDDPPK